MISYKVLRECPTEGGLLALPAENTYHKIGLGSLLNYDKGFILGQTGFSNYGPVNTTLVHWLVAKNGFVSV